MGEIQPEENEPNLNPIEDTETDFGQQPEEGLSGDNSEIDDIFSKLDTEKKAAVIKYAKSMVDSNHDDDTPNEDDMVTEITNNILDTPQKPDDGQDKKIRNKKVTIDNPFITKDFS